jgi:general secretion pathway protein A
LDEKDEIAQQIPAISGNCGYTVGPVPSDDPHHRPLTDDPDFLASLSALDPDLAGGRGRSASAPPARSRPLLELFPPEHGSPFASERPPTVPAPTADFAWSDAPPENPFTLSTDPRFFFHATAHDRAVQELLGAIRRRDPVVLVTGPLGTGKTILCRAVLEQLDRRTIAAFVDQRFVTSEEVLKAVLVQFGVISPEDLARGPLTHATVTELTTALRDFLYSLAPLQASAVLVLDEAQHVPDEALGPLGGLTEIEADGRLLQLVLVGPPAIVGRVRPPGRGTSVPAVTRIELGALAADEVEGYVARRLAVAGSRATIAFDEGAIVRLHVLSGGLPRLVNLLCDRALVAAELASLDGAVMIGDAEIDAAAVELDLAPPPRRRSVAGTLLIGAMLLLLALAGAAAASYVFRAQYDLGIW